MKTQRTIRKLAQRSKKGVDERASTAQWVLAVWAVLLTVLVVVLGGFEDPRLLYNGWLRLCGVLATWGLLAWATATPGRWMAQRLRLGVAVSLVLHTVLALVLVFAHLSFLLTDREPDVYRQLVAEEQEAPKLVEVVRPDTTEQPVFEKPAPTERLMQQKPEAQQAKASSSIPSQPNPETPELASAQAPQSMVERRPRTALVHRAKSPGKRSRQSESATLATTAPKSIAQPDQLAKSDISEPSPAAQVAKAASQPSEQPVREPKLDSKPEDAKTAVRENTDAPRVAETPPTPRRRESPTELVEPAIAVVAPSLTTPQTNRIAAEPSRLERPRSLAVSLQDVVEPQQVRNAPPTKIARRDTRERETPLAASPTPLDRRTPINVARAVAATPQSREAAEVTRTASDTEQPLEPVATSVSKQQSRTMVADATAEAENPSPVAPTTKPNRRTDSQLLAETTSPSRDSSESPKQADLSPVESSPEPLVAAAPRETTQQTSTSPSPRVLADSRGGAATRGDGLNSLNDSPAAPSYSAPFATSSARRERSTQTERGAGLAPNPVAKIARARASAAEPTSTLVALPVPDADVAGAANPQAISASSSAAVDRQFANVTLGDITAAKGEAEFDTGPPQIMPERGSGRGAVGGRLAMRAPQTTSGLGPRRSASAAMSPSATGMASAMAASAPAGASPAAIARSEPQQGGAATPSTAGKPSRVDAPRLVQGRAPAGAISGGGASSPSVGPPAAATEVGAVPPRAGGSIARTRDARSRRNGPMVAMNAAGAPPRSSAGRASPTAAAAAALDPVAIALTTPLAIDLNGRQPLAPAPATSSTANVAPKRKTLMPAELGDGGLATEPTLDAGVPQRIARRQSDTLRLSPSRFANRSEGGKPMPPGRKRNPAPAFAARADRMDAAPIANPSDPRPKTEAAIELGLEFLARLQQEDGRWSLNEFGDLPVPEDEMPSIQADGAATGLALLAFLGGGYDHFDDKYQTVVQRGLDYLVAQQSERGEIFSERQAATVGRNLPAPKATRFYSHGIAALALCEAYGMTGDEELRQPAQAALDYITNTQHQRLNGWRYTEGSNSDLSVTGWQIMALRSGELAGLRVNQRTYSRAKQFVERCRRADGKNALYCYNPFVTGDNEKTKHHDQPGTVMTAVGMLMQLYLGQNRDAPLMQRGADHLVENLPTHSGEYLRVPVGTDENPQRDTYYWYYATQVMFHMGGDHWQRWHEHLHPLLVNHQTLEGPLAGSWNPQKPVPDMWGHVGGRLYVTCLNLLSLEVSYRHLPLYEMTGK